MRKFLIILITFQMITSCLWDSDFKKEIKNPYYLGVDYSTNQVCLHWRNNSLSGGIEKIPSKIIEIGWDDNFIIAKQQPINDKKINYYIIEIQKDSLNCYECPIGPLSEEEFLGRRHDLHIPSELHFKWKVKNFDVVEIKNE